MGDIERTIMADGTCVLRKRALTVLRGELLAQRLQTPHWTVLAAGSIRGGSSLLGYLLREFGLIRGKNIHPITHEDLDFERADGFEEWGSLIRQRNEEYDIWALKLPVIARHMSFFENSVRNPIFIMMVRNPLDTAFSIMNRDDRFDQTLSGLSQSYAVGMEFYNSFFSYIPQSKSPIILISMERAQKHPVLFVQELAETLKRDLPQSSLERMAEQISTPGYKKVEIAV